MDNSGDAKAGDASELLISGYVLASTVRTMSSLGELGMEVLARYGIHDIDVERWYPFAIRAAIHELAYKRYGSEALFSFGFSQGDMFANALGTTRDAYLGYRERFDAAVNDPQKEYAALAYFISGFAAMYNSEIKKFVRPNPQRYGAFSESLGQGRFLFSVTTFASSSDHEAFTRGASLSQILNYVGGEWLLDIRNLPDRTAAGPGWVQFFFELEFTRATIASTHATFVDETRIEAQVRSSEFRLQAREALLKNVVDESNRSLSAMLESISYASLLQQGQMPDPRQLAGPFSSLDVIWKPRDVIGGDIWWTHTSPDGSFTLALVDCTGHGVPGAMLSVLAISTLERIYATDALIAPAQALQTLDDTMRKILHQTASAKYNDDGCDAAIICISADGQSLSFAGAKVDLFHARAGQPAVQLRGTRISLGYRTPPEAAPTQQALSLQPGDRLLMVTDGVTDQIGGVPPKRRAFGNAKIREWLDQSVAIDAPAIAAGLMQAHEQWQGNESRRDDLTIVSIAM